jgi:hypothetical protein
VASVFSSLEAIYYKSKHGLFLVPANAHEESGADGGDLATSDLASLEGFVEEIANLSSWDSVGEVADAAADDGDADASAKEPPPASVVDAVKNDAAGADGQASEVDAQGGAVVASGDDDDSCAADASAKESPHYDRNEHVGAEASSEERENTSPKGQASVAEVAEVDAQAGGVVATADEAVGARGAEKKKRKKKKTTATPASPPQTRSKHTRARSPARPFALMTHLFSLLLQNLRGESFEANKSPRKKVETAPRISDAARLHAIFFPFPRVLQRCSVFPN